MHFIQRPKKDKPVAFCGDYNLLNISGINSHVIFKKSNPECKISRYQLLQNLSRALILPHIERRSKLAQLSTESKTRCLELIGQKPAKKTLSELGLSNDASKTDYGRCHVCRETQAAKESKNSRSLCAKCQKHVCATHMFKMCLNCVQNKFFISYVNSHKEFFC